MGMKIYAGEKSDRNLTTSSYLGEVEGILKLCRKLWSVCNKQPQSFAAIASLNYPRAELVILTEKGMGVVEVKNLPGRIHYYNPDQWYADETQILASSEYRSNPHEQLKQYTRALRNKILYEFAPSLWPRYFQDLQKLRIQTAVCFTHPKADFSELTRIYKPTLEPWENFKILGTEEIVQWAFALNFAVDIRQKGSPEPFTLSPEDVSYLAGQAIRGKEWRDIYYMMPPDEPYGYLIVAESAERYIVPIREDQIWVGRDMDGCKVIVPARCEKVSRRHAMIEWQPEGVFLEDQSKNGSFINGIRLDRPVRLTDHMCVTLGGPDANDKTCQIRFLSNPEEVVRLRTTELGIRYVETPSDLPTEKTSFLRSTDPFNEE
jgi:pSer/pThr/pTyr-binding forkhead associated (FHA) protein